MTTFTRRTFAAGLASLSVLPLTGVPGPAIAAPDFSALAPEKRAAAEESYRKMMAALPFERITVPGAAAEAEWRRLRRQGGAWPVIIGSDGDLERIAEQFSIDDATVFGRSSVPVPKPRSPAEILRAAETIRFPHDLSKWEGAYRPEDLTADEGPWPEKNETEAIGLTIASNTDLKPYDRVHILLIPAEHGWQVPAHLRWGGWNACPPPEYHVSALRLCEEQYGVELVAINGDTMNLLASRPPRDRAKALSLAHDLYRYCPDIVDQGVGTISALAAELGRSPWWYFWWD